MGLRSVQASVSSGARSVPGNDGGRAETNHLDDVFQKVRLSELIEQAEAMEWSTLLEEHEGRLREDVESPPDSVEKLLSMLRGTSCRQVAEIDDNSFRSHLGDQPVWAERLLRLVNDARRIAGRRTAFLLPVFEEQIKESRAQAYRKLVARLAEEVDKGLNAALSSAEAPNAQTQTGMVRWPVNYSFLRCPAGKPSVDAKKKSEHKPPFEGVPPLDCTNDLTRRLFSRTSGGFAEALRKVERPGAVLMEGPTGSGKSLTAGLLADAMRRTLVKVNVSAIAETLVESRIRGFKIGMHSEAHKDTAGWFESAHGGVLFLDEFQNAQDWVQAQLLDLLDAVSDEVRVYRMGEEDVARTCNVKVFLAVNRPVDELLRAGKLREDLYNRVRTVLPFLEFSKLLAEVEEPDGDPLRVFRGGLSPSAYMRKLLAVYRWKFAPTFDDGAGTTRVPLSLFPTFSMDGLHRLQVSPWPGNYRQFEKAAADLFDQLDHEGRATADEEMIVSALSGVSYYLPEEAECEDDSAPEKTVEQVVAQLIEKTLVEEDFTWSRVARRLEPLGMGDVKTLKKRLARYGDMFSAQVRSHPRMHDL